MPNGSFEILSECPSGADLFNATGWFSPNDATPDLFNSCADLSSNLSVPTNGFGFQLAQDGFGYAGIVTYSYNGATNNYREYAEIKMSENLKDNTLYHVEFYFNQANRSPLATNNICFGFVNDTTNQYLSSIIIPDSFEENKDVFLDTLNWKKIEGYYIGTGKESYIIIGNFFNDNNTDTLSSGMPATDVYYYIDNVSVVEFALEIENVFTPNNDGINDIAFHIPDLPSFNVTICNRWGEIVNTVSLSKGWDGKTSSGIDVTEGVYFYYLYSDLNNSKISKTGFIQLYR